MSNIDYTLWPNAGGTLGQNKVQIPDGVTTTWPEGDALVGNFVYNKGELVGFVDTKALIANESKSTTFPYDYVNIQVDKSLEGVMTFNQDERTKYFTVFYAESGNSGDVVMFKYKGCKTLNDIKAVDPNYKTTDIVDGVWSESLADLEDGEEMFDGCPQLISFSSDLSSLTSGWAMFINCWNLTSFTSNLSSLTNGSEMFNSCENLTSFTSNLSSLENGTYMFINCYNLTSFTSNLSSLT
ncbi:MAG: leucine-rich repeat protein [Paludibacteraceae bacterium]|nr:leucine-rich repeat protein [Paludibacteraceae bacterium]